MGSQLCGQEAYILKSVELIDSNLLSPKLRFLSSCGCAEVEVTEVAVTPAFRAVIQRGGEVTCLLFKDEMISLNLKIMAAEATPGDLRAFGESFGSRVRYAYKL